VFEPIKPKMGQTLVDVVGAIDDASFALSHNNQTKTYHPDISQTDHNQEPAYTDRVKAVTFMDVKAITFLVGKEGFDAITAFVEPIGTTAIG